MKKETWKSIFDDRYEVSNSGRVRRKRDGRLLTPQRHSNGYIYFELYPRTGQKQRQLSAHRLVAAAFLGPALGREVNHIDCNPGNPRVENLEYTTRSGNMKHAVAMGRLNDRRGEKNVRAKLTNRDVREIRRRYRRGLGVKLSREFRVSSTMIYYVAKRANWSHL